jgi:pseudouridylate synthase
VISHGLPYPDNIELANEMENIVRRGGATPATIAIIQGRICVGLTKAQLERLGRPDPSQPVVKVSVRDIAATVSQHLDGATTVAATSFIAAQCGIRVFATGGIGGVHREGQVTMDISADLPTLADSHICVVCAGAKSILDLPRTLEYLETLGVCVAGYKTREFPAFFTRHSGLPLECTVQDATEAAQLLHTSMTLGIRQGVLLCVPIAPEHEADGKRIEEATRQALDEANHKGVVGKLITPFLLSRVNELTQGLSKKANLALLKQNATVATAVAVQLAKLRGHQLPGENKSTPGYGQ